ncbi:hypothetical protein U9M48_000656 [Paspalum notatum var. saurae]|uniref:Uncharacterized protein n=1 Tax=Paspalum notatum var. saurae TaxID=547442 RepID=A0AAQ3PFF0_PASNO
MITAAGSHRRRSYIYNSPKGCSLRDRKTSALPGRRLRLHRPGCCHRPSAPPPEADPIDDFPEGLRAYCVRPAALYDEAPAPDEVAVAKHQHRRPSTGRRAAAAGRSHTPPATRRLHHHPTLRSPTR